MNVSVGQSGTGGGFQKFCAGETDISDASRPIKDEEAADCADAGIEYAEIVVANDALTVVVNNENDWATCLTVDELNKMWAPEAEGKITNWSQVRDGFPDVPLELFGAGTDSGTFDYFTDVINGEEGASRTDYNPSEDDNVTVTGVEGDQGRPWATSASRTTRRTLDKLKAVADRRRQRLRGSERRDRLGRHLHARCPGRCSSTCRRSAMATPEVAGVRRLLREQRRRDHREGAVRPAQRRAAAPLAKQELAALVGLGPTHAGLAL